MLKTKVSIERQINERQYQFLVPYEAPLEESLMIIDDIRKYLADCLAEAKEKQQNENK